MTSNSVYLNPDLELLFLQKSGYLTSYPTLSTSASKPVILSSSRPFSPLPKKKKNKCHTHNNDRNASLHNCSHHHSNAKSYSAHKNHYAEGTQDKLSNTFHSALDKENTLKTRLKKCSKANFARQTREFRRECWPTKPKKEIYANDVYTTPISLEDKIGQLRVINDYLKTVTLH